MGKLLRMSLICCVLVLLLFGCGAPQEQKPTMQKLVEKLVEDIKKFLRSPTSTAFDTYVETLTSQTNVQIVQMEKINFINNLWSTFSSLGNDVELLNFYEYSTKSATPIYSFDLNRKPDDIDKVYVMNLLFIDQAQSRKTLYVLPFITLTNEPNKIYLAMIYVRGGNVEVVEVYPEPIVP
ncbi:hypothetical protein [Pseudothermotoga sp.]